LRDRPDLDATSRLSPYLKYGCLHPRQLLARLGDGPSHGRFRTELCWRDFYADVLYHRPDSAREVMDSRMHAMEVDRGAYANDRFDRWVEGHTGYPIVDAGMRQLAAEAWMHNRVRMIVASFLVKDLHLDWRRGARVFMQRLVDGDLASNQHGWQWTAGTGTDAAPYFRIFNPELQGRRFDPDGNYVRRWIPELRGIPGAEVHAPEKARGGRPAAYPQPVVEHRAERVESLRRWDAIRAHT
jgi:deoxyribodipyrimidine photo-lyase